MRRMRYLALVLLLVACGVPEAQEVAPVVAQAERCTVDTLHPGWECCDDDQIGCDSSGPTVCRNHLLQPLSVSTCERIAEDSRRPELRAFGNFCAQNAAGFLWCPVQGRQQ